MKATELYYDRERGMVDVPVNAESKTNSVSIKGPLTKCILPCCTLLSSDGLPLCVFGLSDSLITPLTLHQQLFCENHTVLCRDGISRVFAGVAVNAEKIPDMKKEMVLNQKVYMPVAGDNLLSLPSQVLFVDNDHCEQGRGKCVHVSISVTRFESNQNCLTKVHQE